MVAYRRQTKAPTVDLLAEHGGKRALPASKPYQNEQTEFPQPGVIRSFRRARTVGHFMGYCNGGTPEERDDNPCWRRTCARKR
jgi:hypothetical protein